MPGINRPKRKKMPEHSHDAIGNIVLTDGESLVSEFLCTAMNIHPSGQSYILIRGGDVPTENCKNND
jgi:hypothetical protein